VRIPGISAQLKPGTFFNTDLKIALTEAKKYVSRGGDKLEAALDFWGISVKDCVCLDIGSSTGGFTDCLLQKGAKTVYAVDVGTGQADPKIRNHPRVRLFEKTHILEWVPDFKEERPVLTVMDVSFISLKKVLPKIMVFKTKMILALVKPQFEAPARDLRHGIIKDGAAREMAVGDIVQFAASGFSVQGRLPCPVLGAKGNQEEWLNLSV